MCVRDRERHRSGVYKRLSPSYLTTGKSKEGHLKEEMNEERRGGRVGNSCTSLVASAFEPPARVLP